MALQKAIDGASYHMAGLVLIRADVGYTRVKLVSYVDDAERRKGSEPVRHAWYKFESVQPSVADCYAELKKQAEWADARDA